MLHIWDKICTLAGTFYDHTEYVCFAVSKNFRVNKTNQWEIPDC